METQTKKYTHQDNRFFMGEKERQYVLTVHDLPEEEKPREKLLDQGPDSLSMAELMAVIIGSGTKKEEVLTMAHRITKEYGEKSVLSQKDASKLADDLNIPLGKALKIVACGELGRRAFSRNESGAPTVRTAREVFEYVSDMRDLPKEHLRGLYLNSRYKVIHDEVVSMGTVDASIIHPREVFKPAIEYGAVAIVLAHNHPSGSMEPSSTDKAMTEQLIEASHLLGIDLIDHVIVTKDGYASIPAPYRY